MEQATVHGAATPRNTPGWIDREGAGTRGCITTHVREKNPGADTLNPIIPQPDVHAPFPQLYSPDQGVALYNSYPSRTDQTDFTRLYSPGPGVWGWEKKKGVVI